ncbi:MAG: CaiB/BaiF CoA transferase family protein [Pseudomonadota bacterium]
MSRISGFLQGTKVVDLSRHLPGPLASLLMVDMGARVIKVEPPQGEEMRFIGPVGAQGTSVYFDAVNAGKTGVKLDLKNGDQRAQLLELLTDADVLIESFRPGVLEKLGIGIDFLRQEFPRLVICSLNGYGDHSPLRNDVGHDLNYLAMNGVLAGTGTVEQTVAPWPPLADCAASLFGLSTILGALLERERSGNGCHVEVALADSVMPLMQFSLAELGLKGRGIPRAEDLLNGGAARYRTYRTADGFSVALGAVEPKFWQAFCHAAGRADWIARMDDPLPQTDLQQELVAFFAALTLQQCNERFGNVDCCFNQVLELHEAVQTPHLQARQLVVQPRPGEFQALYPAYVDGAPPQPRAPFCETH